MTFPTVFRLASLAGIIFTPFLMAENEHSRTFVEIWPEGAPGAIAAAGYEEAALPADGEVPVPHTAAVSAPQLVLYLPEGGGGPYPAVIVCPGGGYGFLADQHEGAAVAEWFRERGIAAFVLKYRLPSDIIMEDKSLGPLQDAQEAVRIVRRRAEEWGVDPGRVGIMGFSAGGHLAATASTLYDDEAYPRRSGDWSARPDLSILIYPVISMDFDITHRGSRENLLGVDAPQGQVSRFSAHLRIDAATPPAFLVHSADDAAVPVENSVRYFLALQDHGVDAELHVFPTGGHGYGLGAAVEGASQWPQLLETWLRAQGW